MRTKNLFIQIKQILINTTRLFKLAWKMERKITVLYYLTAIIGALVPFISAYALQILIDQLQLAQGIITASVPMIVIVVLASRYVITLLDGVVYGGINQSYLDYIFRNKLQNEITYMFQKKVSTLDIAHFENPEVQDLIAKTRDTMQSQIPDFLREFAFLLRDIFSILFAFFALVQFGWWIPIFVSLIAVPRLYLLAKYGRIEWSIWSSNAPKTRKLWYLNSLLQEPTVVKESRIFQSSKSLLNMFRETQQYLYNRNKKALDKYLFVLTIPPIFEIIVIFFIAYQFLPSVTSGILTIGSYTLMLTMLERLWSGSTSASTKFAKIYENNLYVNHFYKFLSLPKLVKICKKPIKIDSTKIPKIEFRNVTFCYPNGRKALDNISFIIEPGTNIALVGHNGAGKTTIVKLLCRFYDATSGEILINDINIKDIDLPSWYKSISTLFQEFAKYHFSVKENILLGDNDKNDEKLMKSSANRSGASRFINNMSNKFSTLLGKEFENGEEISGGQWQKLAIARAFYKDAPILIMDEPTSAIDAEAEYEIFKNLKYQYKNKTLILISHRFSTVRIANKIIIMNHGKITECGSHDELMKLRGEYSKLFSIQAKGYK